MRAEFTPLGVKPRDRFQIGLKVYCPSVFGAFAKLRKATISFVMSVRPSAWNRKAATGRIFMVFDI